MQPQGKRGVTNVVLMLGVAICLAILLIGGILLVTKFVEAQARASPEYVATELVTLINTVQTAPETITFQYYPEIGADGYPVIGSLEIDDNLNKLCVQPKTENEIFGSIVEQAAIGAGFGSAGFARNQVRAAVVKRSTQKALMDDALFSGPKNPGPLSWGLDKQLLYKVGEDSEKGVLARKYLLGEGMSKSEGQAFSKLFSEEEFVQMRNAQQKVSNMDAVALRAANYKPDSIIERIEMKLPLTDERKISLLGQRYMVYLQEQGEKPLVQRVKGTLVKAIKTPGALVSATIKGTVIGATLAATYFLSGGDWTTTTLVAVQLTIMHYAPKIVEKVVLKLAPRFAETLAAAVPPAVSFATAYKIYGEQARYWCMTCAGFPPACPMCASFTTMAGYSKVAEVIVNIGFSVYTTVNIDTTLGIISAMSGHQVAVERDALVCKTFEASKQVLLTPPNCNPEIRYGDSTTEAKRLGLSAIFTSQAIMLGGETVWAAATGYIPGGALVARIAQYGIFLAQVGVPVGSLVAFVTTDPSVVIPRAECSSCDTTYWHQDCPNWYLSDSGAGSEIGGWTFVGFLQGGPVCAGLALTGMAGMLCDATRVMAAMAVFTASPAHVYNFFLHGYEVGLQKTVGSKTALGLTNEFADNTGYWYAELPYAIEFTKIYNSTAAIDRDLPLIIRKV